MEFVFESLAHHPRVVQARAFEKFLGENDSDKDKPN